MTKPRLQATGQFKPPPMKQRASQIIAMIIVRHGPRLSRTKVRHGGSPGTTQIPVNSRLNQPSLIQELVATRPMGSRHNFFQLTLKFVHREWFG